jgi:hypothetical protein
MTRRLHPRALALALAVLVLAAPAASANPLVWPHTSELTAPAASTPVAPTSMDRLTEEQILASRGQGAPRRAATDWTAEGAWAAGAVILIGLTALSARALTTRRVPA